MDFLAVQAEFPDDDSDRQISWWDAYEYLDDAQAACLDDLKVYALDNALDWQFDENAWFWHADVTTLMGERRRYTIRRVKIKTE